MSRRTTQWRGLVMAAVLGAAMNVAAEPKALPTTGVPSGAWSQSVPSVETQVLSDRKLVVEVFVPLCSEKRGGPCGKHKGAGEADNLEDNIYWGAIWGARRYLERKWLGWSVVEESEGEAWELSRVTLKRQVSGARWGGGAEVEQIVVLHAVHGDSGEDALTRFRDRATGGGQITFRDGGELRTESVHVAGFMGRNPLLVNGRPPKHPNLPQATAHANAIASFSIAAHSRETLGHWLDTSGTKALLLPRGAVASEAYVLSAVLDGLAANEHRHHIESRVIREYTKFQKVPRITSELYYRKYPQVGGA